MSFGFNSAFPTEIHAPAYKKSEVEIDEDEGYDVAWIFPIIIREGGNIRNAAILSAQFILDAINILKKEGKSLETFEEDRKFAFFIVQNVEAILQKTKSSIIWNANAEDLKSYWSEITHILKLAKQAFSASIWEDNGEEKEDMEFRQEIEETRDEYAALLSENGYRVFWNDGYVIDKPCWENK